MAGSRAIVHGGFGPCLTRAKGDKYFFLYQGACRTHVELELGSAEGSAEVLHCRAASGRLMGRGTMDGEDCMLIILQARISPESRVQSDRRARPEASAIRDWQGGGSVCFIGSSMQSVSPVSRSSAVCASSNTCVSHCKPAVSRIQYNTLLCSTLLRLPADKREATTACAHRCVSSPGVRYQRAASTAAQTVTVGHALELADHVASSHEACRLRGKHVR